MASTGGPVENVDSQTQLLVAMIKNTNGQINFQGVANDMGLSSAGAAQKRVKRYLEKISPGVALLCGSTLGNGGPATSSKAALQQADDGDETASPKTLKTPKAPKASKTPKSGGKRERADAEENDLDQEQKKLKTQD